MTTWCNGDMPCYDIVGRIFMYEMFGRSVACMGWVRRQRGRNDTDRPLSAIELKAIFQMGRNAEELIFP